MGDKQLAIGVHAKLEFKIEWIFGHGFEFTP